MDGYPLDYYLAELGHEEYARFRQILESVVKADPVLGPRWMAIESHIDAEMARMAEESANYHADLEEGRRQLMEDLADERFIRSWEYPPVQTSMDCQPRWEDTDVPY